MDLMEKYVEILSIIFLTIIKISKLYYNIIQNLQTNNILLLPIKRNSAYLTVIWFKK